jgi:outer membrane biogenesis lipoprotein LolB
MKQALRLPLVAFLALLAGCFVHRGRPTDAPPAAVAPLAGVWENPETQDRHTIRWQRGHFYVASVESSSGERYVVSEQQWKDGVLRWGYHIPSTHYVITLRTRRVAGSRLELDWSDSDGNTRDEVLRRVGGH